MNRPLLRPERREAVRYRHLCDGVLIADSGAWAWLRLGVHGYDVASDADKTQRLTGLARAVANLRDADAHLIVAPRPFDTAAWAQALTDPARTPRPQPGWGPYTAGLAGYVAELGLWERRVYLGVRLTERRADGPAGAGRVWRAAQAAFGVADPGPAGWDPARCAEQAALLARSVAAGGAPCELAPAADIAWLIARSLRRGTGAEPPPPPSNGAWDGRLDALVEGRVVNGRRRLRVETDGAVGHLACLALAGLPDEIGFPGGEWLLWDDLSFPVEASVRFRVVPARRAAKDADKHLAAVRDQLKNIRDAGLDEPLELLEAETAMLALSHQVTRERAPLIYSWPRILVAAGSAEELTVRVQDVRDHYADRDITVEAPTGDQLALFLEALPAGRVRVRSYQQRQSAAAFAAAMPTASSVLGDGTGPYLGTTVGVGESPVMLDVFRACRQLDESPALAVTGQPGRGKTTAASLLTYQARLRGAWCLVIDPKKEMGRLASLPGIGASQVVALDEHYQGCLDPFATISDRDHAKLMAVDLLRLLLPVEDGRRVEAALLRAAAAEAKVAAPTLDGVVDRLRRADALEGRDAGKTLAALASYPVARLFFSRDGVRPLALTDSLTVIQFGNVSFPETGKAAGEWTITDRFGTALLFALSGLVGRMMDLADPGVPKLVLLDEAHNLTRTSSGAEQVRRITRQGRSKNTSILLVTQNASDLLDETITNNVKQFLCFQAEDRGEVAAVLGLLGRDDPDHSLAHHVSGLAQGEALLRDIDGNVGRVAVDLVFDDLVDAFATNPSARRGLAPRRSA